ncbi:hypothetical protein [Paenibacillus motobuensis]|uniref:hypothetical protein n=1 Tax=Paenibacillus motobuensis TaxID=295324 RepID=UPI0031E068DC
MIPLVTRSLIFLLLLSIFSYGPVMVYANNKTPSVTVTICVRINPSAAYEHKTVLTDAAALQLLKGSKEEKAERSAGLSDIFITIIQYGKTSHFRMEKSGALWNETELTRLVLTRKATIQLEAHAKSLRASHYGSILPWSEVSKLLPKKSKFSIIDMEKGLEFRAQRRAGSRHADVQPLTKEDTKTMKQIFDNRWSWDRRAIIVVLDNNTRIAASMNGMPHGGDGIPDNGFSGHFCIHFLSSCTHRSVHPDLFHQLMVYTAAGRRGEFLNSLSPDKLAQTFIGALSQRDSDLIKTVLEGANTETVNTFLKELEDGTAFRIIIRKRSTLKDKEYGLTEHLVIPIIMKRKNQLEQSVSLQFELVRESVYSPWRIMNVQFKR